MINVAAGIISKDDRILICRRGPGRDHEGLWEFPGGKLESSESPEACLARELQEELSLPVSNLSLYKESVFGNIHFYFITGKTNAEPILTEHTQYIFAVPQDLKNYTFCPADQAVAAKLYVQSLDICSFFWDLDGTLLDTYPMILETVLKAFSAMSIPVDEHEVYDLLKVSLPHCCQTICARYHADEQEMMKHYHAFEKDCDYSGVTAMPGMKQLLEKLAAQGSRHYLVTHRNSSAWALLEHTGLRSYFSGGITSDDGFPRKPDPSSLRHLLGKYHLSASRCVMIGDRPLDTQAGQNADMLSVLYDPEKRYVGTPADYYATDAHELCDLFTKR